MAARAWGEPSEPTTTPSTSARVPVSSSRVRCSFDHGRGTTPVGHPACPGTAVETVPSSRPSSPPRPREPRTSSSAVRLSSSRVPEGSPVSTVARSSTPTSRIWPAAWSSSWRMDTRAMEVS